MSSNDFRRCLCGFSGEVNEFKGLLYTGIYLGDIQINGTTSMFSTPAFLICPKCGAARGFGKAEADN